MTGFIAYRTRNFGDISNFYRNDRDQGENARFAAYEFSCRYNFSPKASLLVFYSFHRGNDPRSAKYPDLVDPREGIIVRTFFFDAFDNYFPNLRGQVEIILAKHRILAGYDYFTGPIRWQVKLLQYLLGNEYN